MGTQGWMLGSGFALAKSPVRSRRGIAVVNRWDEKAGLRRDAIRSQVIDALKGARDKGDRQ